MAGHENVIKYYDGCSQEYDIAWTGKKDLAIHYGFWEPGTRSHSDALINMNRVLASTAGIRKRDYMLDAGCGIGGSSIWVAENIGARVCGITIAQRQAARANRLAAERGVGHLAKFHVSDYLSTGFKGSTFDVVWALESACHAEEKGDFINEAYRILKPGGRLVVADGFAAKEGYGPKEEIAMRKWLGGWAVPNLAEAGQFRKQMESAGFRKIRFVDIKANVMRSSRRMYLGSMLGIGVWEILRLLGIKSGASVKHILGGIYQHEALKRGLWTYGIFYGEKPE